MADKTYDSLYTVFVDGIPTYPGFAQKLFNDTLYGPRIQRRLKRLLADHPDGLPERGHDWYFGYLVCAYSQVHYGNKNLLNFTYVTQEIFELFVAQQQSTRR